MMHMSCRKRNGPRISAVFCTVCTAESRAEVLGWKCDCWRDTFLCALVELGQEVAQARWWRWSWTVQPSE